MTSHQEKCQADLETRIKKHPSASCAKAGEADVEPLVIADDGTIVVPPDAIEFLHGWKPITEAIMKDVVESERTAKAIGATPKQCWFNARKAIFKLDNYAEASYVEGWALCRAMPLEHGWIVRNGVIIDPTLPKHPIIYFPGLEFCGREGIKSFLNIPEGKKHKREPFFYAFGWGGMQSPHFRKCYEQAMASLRETQPGSAA